jgi:hypothetical protein
MINFIIAILIGGAIVGSIVAYNIVFDEHIGLYRKQRSSKKQGYDLKKSLKEMLKQHMVCEYCPNIIEKDTEFCGRCGKRNWKSFIERMKK